jgi:TonB family protein
MFRTTTIAVLLAFACEPVLSAQCELSETIDAGYLSPEKLAIRGAIFQELCKRSGGALVDGDNAQLKTRIVFPGGGKPIRQEFQSNVPLDEIFRQLKTRKVILAYIVEPTGKVSWVTVLESSGDKSVDAFAFARIRELNFRGAVTLDGQPVRLFRTTQYGPLQ